MRHFSQLAVVGLLLLLISTMPASASPPTTDADFAIVNPAFTYQGSLRHNADPVNGPCNFQFALFDAATGGTQLGNTQNAAAVNVIGGLFMVQLNGMANSVRMLLMGIHVGYKLPYNVRQTPH